MVIPQGGVVREAGAKGDGGAGRRAGRRFAGRMRPLWWCLALAGALLIGAAPEAASQRAPGRRGGGRPERKALSNLVLPDLDGRRWSLEEHRGRVVLINFWATWCPPCRAETPVLIGLAKKFEAVGLDVAGVALDQDGEGLIRQFVDEFGVPYPVLIPAPGSALSRIEPVPTTVLVDRRGRLAKKYVGAVSKAVIERDVRRLLTER